MSCFSTNDVVIDALHIDEEAIVHEQLQKLTNKLRKVRYAAVIDSEGYILYSYTKEDELPLEYFDYSSSLIRQSSKFVRTLQLFSNSSQEESVKCIKVRGERDIQWNMYEIVPNDIYLIFFDLKVPAVASVFHESDFGENIINEVLKELKNLLWNNNKKNSPL